MQRPFMTLAITLVLATRVSAAPPERNHDVTIDDYFTQSIVTDVLLSPDGTKVLYTEQRWEPPRETRNADLWLVSVDGGAPRRLTFDFGGEASPQWAPDGKSIYYLASRTQDDGKFPPFNGKIQVWQMMLETGQVVPITRIEKGVDRFQLAESGKTIYFMVSKDSQTDPWKSLQTRFNTPEYGYGKRVVSELWKLDLSTFREEKLVDLDQHIHDFSVTPDESRVAMICTKDAEPISSEGFSDVVIYDFAERKSSTLPDDLWRKQAPSPFGWLGSLAWSTDSARLAFTVSFDGYPTEVIVAQGIGKQPQPQLWRLTRQEEVHFGEGRLRWQGERNLLLTGFSHARHRVLRIADIDSGKQGATETLIPGDVVISAFSISKQNNRLVVVKADPSSTEDVFLVDESVKPANYRRLTETNPQMRTWKLPQLQVVSWVGAEGDIVEGVLELPPDYKQGDKLPLVVLIHGGPTADAPYCLRYWPYGEMQFAARGYARLSPNYHGSTGYGDKFMTKLVGHENDIDVKDLITGVNAMIEKGIADPEKLAVTGWSNGGFLTTALVVTDQRFKAASCGAGVLEQFMQWGLQDTPGHVINFMEGKLPWEAPERYRKSSPVYQLDRVKTPMLIHVGEADSRVPAAHSRALHRALMRYLKVPTQLIIYPGESHSLMKLEDRRAKMEWDQAWFDHYVLGKPIPGEK